MPDIDILAVNDDPEILFDTARTLRKGGFIVFEASTGGVSDQMIVKNKF